MNPYQLSVIKNHVSNDPKPLILKRGDIVKLGKRYTKNLKWQNWIWCQTNKSAGWAPIQIIKVDRGRGLILNDYTAQELTVLRGERVSVVRELNGWVWCESENGASGWIPKENLENT